MKRKLKFSQKKRKRREATNRVKNKRLLIKMRMRVKKK